MTEKDVLHNFVAGERVAPADGRYADLVDPVTGEVFAAAPVCDARDVDAAMRAARPPSRAGGTPPRRSGSGRC